MCSNAREGVQGFGDSGRGKADSEADQRANHWGRNGGDPNRYRPNGLPNKYWKKIISAKENDCNHFTVILIIQFCIKKLSLFYYILTIIFS